MKDPIKIAMIGAGNMASAIVGGQTDPENENRVAKENIILFDVDRTKYERFGDGFVLADDIPSAVLSADIIFFAVKPQNYPDVLALAATAAAPEKVFVSIAAGISISNISEVLGKNAKIVRALPNTPLLVGAGATALCRNAGVSDEEYTAVRSIFASRGLVIDLDEDQMNRIVSVTSSSPAYFFLMIKAMVDSASAQGLAIENLRKAVCTAMIGSAKFALQSEKSLDELIRMVTTPHGTTEQALRVFEEEDFCGMVDRAMRACTHRADELGKKV